MKGNSSRHHYIPKFLINGFTDDEGFVYVYDKLKDKILKNKRSPKSVFFESNRNTIEINKTQSSSLIEDKFFMELDNKSSKLILALQKHEITKDLLSRENQGELQFFLINLFWRLPLTDDAVSDLFERAKIVSEGVNIERLRSDINFRKVKRIGLFKHTIDELKDFKPDKNEYFAKLTEFPNDEFLLGDFPMLFESTPKKFTDLSYFDYLFALSSRRIFTSTKSVFGSFSKYDIVSYNVSIISQSKQYVCSGNLELLNQSIKCYRDLKKEGLHHHVKNRLFIRKNK